MKKSKIKKIDIYDFSTAGFIRRCPIICSIKIWRRVNFLRPEVSYIDITKKILKSLVSLRMRKTFVTSGREYIQVSYGEKTNKPSGFHTVTHYYFNRKDFLNVFLPEMYKDDPEFIPLFLGETSANG